MKTSNLPAMIEKNLPAFSNSSLTYNAARNMYLTQGYTSAAGNTYYQAIKASDKLIVAMQIGEGYYYTFLNGIKLFCWDGNKPVLIGQKAWGGCDNWVRYSDYFALNQSVGMLKDYLSSQLKLQGVQADESQLLEYSRNLLLGGQAKKLN